MSNKLEIQMLLQPDLLEPIHGALLSFGCCLWRSVGTGKGKQMCVRNQYVLEECFRPFEVVLFKENCLRWKWKQNSGELSARMRIQERGETADVYGWGHDGESERRGRRAMFMGGGVARPVNCLWNENGSLAESRTLGRCTGSMSLIYCLKACQEEREVEEGEDVPGEVRA